MFWKRAISHLTRFSAWFFLPVLVWSLVEAGIIFRLYAGLREHVIAQPVFFSVHLFSTMALAGGVLALLAAVVAALLERRFETHNAAAMASGFVACLAVLGAGLCALAGVFPDQSWSTGKPRVGLMLVAGSALIGGLAVGAFTRGFGRSGTGREMRMALAYWGLAVSGWLLPAGVKEPIVLSETAAEAASQTSLPSVPVILLTVDTLRAGHMSLYGYARDTTPGIDEWASRNVVFKQAITPKTSTAPALASLITGTHPYLNAVAANGDRLSDSFDTLAELFAEKGYRCAGFISNHAVADPNFGFSQGFHEWTSYKHPDDRAEDVLHDATEWLSRHKEETFFAWIHLMDPHTPYLPPFPYNQRFVGDDHYARYDGVVYKTTERAAGLGEVNLRDALGGNWKILGLDEATLKNPNYLVAQYDGEIAYMDEQAARFLSFLEEAVPDALVIFTSDHGESMVEHNYFFFHGRFCYETTCHVPLIIAHKIFPKAHSAARLVSLLDVLPTLGELLGVRVPDYVEGVSLAGDLQNPRSTASITHNRAVLIEAMVSSTYPTKALRTETWKLILTPDRKFVPLDFLIQAQMRFTPLGTLLAPHFCRSYREELYDLKHDKAETKNVAGKHRDVRGALRERMWKQMETQHLRRLALGVSAVAAPLSQESVEQLKALGYIH